MTITRQITADWGQTGLTGTLAYRVVDADDSSLIARATAGVTEFPAGSGCYRAKLTNWDASWGAKVVWDDGVLYATEWIAPIAIVRNISVA